MGPMPQFDISSPTDVTEETTTTAAVATKLTRPNSRMLPVTTKTQEVQKDAKKEASNPGTREDSGAQEPVDIEENVKCDLCQEEVEEGDNYKLHLVQEHNISMEDLEAMADAAM